MSLSAAVAVISVLPVPFTVKTPSGVASTTFGFEDENVTVLSSAFSTESTGKSLP